MIRLILIFVKMYINNGKEYLNVLKLNYIFNKILEFKIGYRVGSSIQRYEKYTKRGFNIINNMTYEEIANKAIKILDRGHCMADNYGGVINLYHMDEVAMDEYKVKNKKFHIHSDIINLSGDFISYYQNKGYLKIIRKQNICHDNCLMRFCNSDQKHICYDTKNGQYIFIID